MEIRQSRSGFAQPCIGTLRPGITRPHLPSPALAGIQLQGEWVLFWLVYFTTLSVGIILAYLVATLSPNLDVANAVGGALCVCAALKAPLASLRVHRVSAPGMHLQTSDPPGSSPDCPTHP